MEQDQTSWPIFCVEEMQEARYMKKRKIMEGPERVVCCTLCLCMAVAVFSSVALVYLTALVYMPAKREIESGKAARKWVSTVC